jgi:hypothetical protein
VFLSLFAGRYSLLKGLKLARFDLARQHDPLYLDHFGAIADFNGVFIGV